MARTTFTALGELRREVRTLAREEASAGERLKAAQEKLAEHKKSIPERQAKALEEAQRESEAVNDSILKLEKLRGRKGLKKEAFEQLEKAIMEKRNSVVEIYRKHFEKAGVAKENVEWTVNSVIGKMRGVRETEVEIGRAQTELKQAKIKLSEANKDLAKQTGIAEKLYPNELARMDAARPMMDQLKMLVEKYQQSLKKINDVYEAKKVEGKLSKAEQELKQEALEKLRNEAVENLRDSFRSSAEKLVPEFAKDRVFEAQVLQEVVREMKSDLDVKAEKLSKAEERVEKLKEQMMDEAFAEKDRSAQEQLETEIAVAQAELKKAEVEAGAKERTEQVLEFVSRAEKGVVKDNTAEFESFVKTTKGTSSEEYKSLKEAMNDRTEKTKARDEAKASSEKKFSDLMKEKVSEEIADLEGEGITKKIKRNKELIERHEKKQTKQREKLEKLRKQLDAVGRIARRLGKGEKIEKQIEKLKKQINDKAASIRKIEAENRSLSRKYNESSIEGLEKQLVVAEKRAAEDPIERKTKKVKEIKDSLAEARTKLENLRRAREEVDFEAAAREDLAEIRRAVEEGVTPEEMRPLNVMEAVELYNRMHSLTKGEKVNEFFESKEGESMRTLMTAEAKRWGAKDAAELYNIVNEVQSGKVKTRTIAERAKALKAGIETLPAKEQSLKAKERKLNADRAKLERLRQADKVMAESAKETGETGRDALNSERAKVENRLAELEGERITLKTEIAEARSSLNEAQTGLQRMLAVESAGYRSAYAAFTAAKQVYEDAVNVEEAKVREEYETRRAELENYRREFVVEELTRISTKIRTYEESITSLKRDLVKAKKIEDVAERKTRTAELRNEIDFRNGQIKELKTAENRLNDVRAKIIEVQMLTAPELREKLSEELVTAEKDLRRLENEQGGAREKGEEAKVSELEARINEVKTKKDRINELLKRKVAKEDMLRFYQDMLLSGVSEFKSLREQIKAIEGKLESVGALRAEARGRVSETDRNISKRENEIKELKNKQRKAETQAKADALGSRIAELRAEITKLEAARAPELSGKRPSETFSKAQTEIETFMEYGHSKLTGQLREAEAKLASARKEYKAAKERAAEDFREISKLDAIEAKIKGLEGEANSIREKMNETLQGRVETARRLEKEILSERSVLEAEGITTAKEAESYLKKAEKKAAEVQEYAEEAGLLNKKGEPKNKRAEELIERKRQEAGLNTELTAKVKAVFEKMTQLKKLASGLAKDFKMSKEDKFEEYVRKNELLDKDTGLPKDAEATTLIDAKRRELLPAKGELRALENKLKEAPEARRKAMLEVEIGVLEKSPGTEVGFVAEGLIPAELMGRLSNTEISSLVRVMEGKHNEMSRKAAEPLLAVIDKELDDIKTFEEQMEKMLEYEKIENGEMVTARKGLRRASMEMNEGLRNAIKERILERLEKTSFDNKTLEGLKNIKKHTDRLFADRVKIRGEQKELKKEREMLESRPEELRTKAEEARIKELKSAEKNLSMLYSKLVEINGKIEAGGLGAEMIRKIRSAGEGVSLIDIYNDVTGISAMHDATNLSRINRRISSIETQLRSGTLTSKAAGKLTRERANLRMQRQMAEMPTAVRNAVEMKQSIDFINVRINKIRGELGAAEGARRAMLENEKTGLEARRTELERSLEKNESLAEFSEYLNAKAMFRGEKSRLYETANKLTRLGREHLAELSGTQRMQSLLGSINVGNFKSVLGELISRRGSAVMMERMSECAKSAEVYGSALSIVNPKLAEDFANRYGEEYRNKRVVEIIEAIENGTISPRNTEVVELMINIVEKSFWTNKKGEKKYENDIGEMDEFRKEFLRHIAENGGVGSAAAGAGKTMLYSMVIVSQYLIRKNSPEGFSANVLVPLRGNIKTFTGATDNPEYMAFGEHEILKRFGLEYVDGSKLFEDFKNRKNEKLIEALKDPSKVIVWDFSTRGFVALEAKQNRKLREALKKLNIECIDEIDSIALARESFIQSGTGEGGMKVKGRTATEDFIKGITELKNTMEKWLGEDAVSKVKGKRMVEDWKSPEMPKEAELTRMKSEGKVIRVDKVSIDLINQLSEKGISAYGQDAQGSYFANEAFVKKFNSMKGAEFRNFTVGELTSALRAFEGQRGKNFALNHKGTFEPINEVGEINVNRRDSDDIYLLYTQLKVNSIIDNKGQVKAWELDESGNKIREVTLTKALKVKAPDVELSSTSSQATLKNIFDRGPAKDANGKPVNEEGFFRFGGSATINVATPIIEALQGCRLKAITASEIYQEFNPGKGDKMIAYKSGSKEAQISQIAEDVAEGYNSTDVNMPGRGRSLVITNEVEDVHAIKKELLRRGVDSSRILLVDAYATPKELNAIKSRNRDLRPGEKGFIIVACLKASRGINFGGNFNEYLVDAHKMHTDDIAQAMTRSRRSGAEKSAKNLEGRYDGLRKLYYDKAESQLTMKKMLETNERIIEENDAKRGVEQKTLFQLEGVKKTVNGEEITVRLSDTPKTAMKKARDYFKIEQSINKKDGDVLRHVQFELLKVRDLKVDRGRWNKFSAKEQEYIEKGIEGRRDLKREKYLMAGERLSVLFDIFTEARGKNKNMPIEEVIKRSGLTEAEVFELKAGYESLAARSNAVNFFLGGLYKHEMLSNPLENMIYRAEDMAVKDAKYKESTKLLKEILNETYKEGETGKEGEAYRPKQGRYYNEMDFKTGHDRILETISSEAGRADFFWSKFLHAATEGKYKGKIRKEFIREAENIRDAVRNAKSKVNEAKKEEGKASKKLIDIAGKQKKDIKSFSEIQSKDEHGNYRFTDLMLTGENMMDYVLTSKGSELITERDVERVSTATKGKVNLKGIKENSMLQGGINLMKGTSSLAYSGAMINEALKVIQEGEKDEKDDMIARMMAEKGMKMPEKKKEKPVLSADDQRLVADLKQFQNYIYDAGDIAEELKPEPQTTADVIKQKAIDTAKAKADRIYKIYNKGRENFKIMSLAQQMDFVLNNIAGGDVERAAQVIAYANPFLDKSDYIRALGSEGMNAANDESFFKLATVLLRDLDAHQIAREVDRDELNGFMKAVNERMANYGSLPVEMKYDVFSMVHGLHKGLERDQIAFVAGRSSEFSGVMERVDEIISTSTAQDNFEDMGYEDKARMIGIVLDRFEKDPFNENYQDELRRTVSSALFTGTFTLEAGDTAAASKIETALNILDAVERSGVKMAEARTLEERFMRGVENISPETLSGLTDAQKSRLNTALKKFQTTASTSRMRMLARRAEEKVSKAGMLAKGRKVISMEEWNRSVNDEMTEDYNKQLPRTGTESYNYFSNNFIDSVVAGLKKQGVDGETSQKAEKLLRELKGAIRSREGELISDAYIMGFVSRLMDICGIEEGANLYSMVRENVFHEMAHIYLDNREGGRELVKALSNDQNFGSWKKTFEDQYGVIEREKGESQEDYNYRVAHEIIAKMLTYKYKYRTLLDNSQMSADQRDKIMKDNFGRMLDVFGKINLSVMSEAPVNPYRQSIAHEAYMSLNRFTVDAESAKKALKAIREELGYAGAKITRSTQYSGEEGEKAKEQAARTDTLLTEIERQVYDREAQAVLDKKELSDIMAFINSGKVFKVSKEFMDGIKEALRVKVLAMNNASLAAFTLTLRTMILEDKIDSAGTGLYQDLMQDILDKNETFGNVKGLDPADLLEVVVDTAGLKYLDARAANAKLVSALRRKAAERAADIRMKVFGVLMRLMLNSAQVGLGETGALMLSNNIAALTDNLPLLDALVIYNDTIKTFEAMKKDEIRDGDRKLMASMGRIIAGKLAKAVPDSAKRERRSRQILALINAMREAGLSDSAIVAELKVHDPMKLLEAPTSERIDTIIAMLSAGEVNEATAKRIEFLADMMEKLADHSNKSFDFVANTVGERDDLEALADVAMDMYPFSTAYVDGIFKALTEGKNINDITLRDLFAQVPELKKNEIERDIFVNELMMRLEGEQEMTPELVRMRTEADMLSEAGLDIPLSKIRMAVAATDRSKDRLVTEYQENKEKLLARLQLLAAGDFDAEAVFDSIGKSYEGLAEKDNAFATAVLGEMLLAIELARKSQLQSIVRDQLSSIAKVVGENVPQPGTMMVVDFDQFSDPKNLTMVSAIKRAIMEGKNVMWFSSTMPRKLLEAKLKEKGIAFDKKMIIGVAGEDLKAMKNRDPEALENFRGRINTAINKWAEVKGIPRSKVIVFTSAQNLKDFFFAEAQEFLYALFSNEGGTLIVSSEAVALLKEIGPIVYDEIVSETVEGINEIKLLPELMEGVDRINVYEKMKDVELQAFLEIEYVFGEEVMVA
ncbi:hypothetical protein ACFLQ8_01175 [Candidatus Auribacterota bacterium]